MSNIWLTSDLHIGHNNIIKYCNRPFKDIAEMTEMLITNHNAVVAADDLVIDLGDFSLDERRVAPTLKRMNGKRILVVGNHDQCHPVHRGAEAAKKRYLEAGFQEVVVSMDMEIGGEKVHIHHMPYNADEIHGNKWEKWRPVDDGRWLCHGHTHGLWKEKGRMIDVGVDARNYAPIHIEDIAKIIKGAQ
jgi:calcineurin-like phosphoesterase family protein